MTFAHTHHATISSRAAADLDISASCLTSWCQQGRLAHPSPNVFVVCGSPVTWRQRVIVAALSTDGWASHRTAAALWGLDGFTPRQVEVLRIHGQWRLRADWTVHVTRRFSGVDIAEVDGIPCTSVARTVLDLLAVTGPFKVGQALDYACRKRPGMLDTIAQRFLELAGRGWKGTRLMRAMLDERLGRGTFAQSGFEALALDLVRSIGLPEPALHFHIRHGEFSAYPDLAWPAIRWAIECDSLAWHSGKRAHEWDRYRRRKLKQLGWDIVEVTFDDVTKRRSETARQLRGLYRAREHAVLVAPDSRW